MKIVCCVATYKGAHRIERNFFRTPAESLVGEARFWPLVIYDDGSPSDHYQYLERTLAPRLRAHGYCSVHVVHGHANKGCAGAYNEVVRWVANMQADAVLLLDDDAWIPPGLWSTARTLLFLPNIGVLSWKSRGTQPGQTETPRYGALELATELAGYCYAFPIGLYHELGGFDERFRHYHADSDFALRAMHAGHPCYRVHWPLVPHEEHQAFIDSPELERDHWVQADYAAWLAKWGQPGPDCERAAIRQLLGV
jgi:GT2 family glycosyltransferase